MEYGGDVWCDFLCGDCANRAAYHQHVDIGPKSRDRMLHNFSLREHDPSDDVYVSTVLVAYFGQPLFQCSPRRPTTAGVPTSTLPILRLGVRSSAARETAMWPPCRRAAR